MTPQQPKTPPNVSSADQAFLDAIAQLPTDATPPAQLDAAILAASRRAVRVRPLARLRPWLSAAAVVFVSFFAVNLLQRERADDSLNSIQRESPAAQSSPTPPSGPADLPSADSVQTGGLVEPAEDALDKRQTGLEERTAVLGDRLTESQTAATPEPATRRAPAAVGPEPAPAVAKPKVIRPTLRKVPEPEPVPAPAPVPERRARPEPFSSDSAERGEQKAARMPLAPPSAARARLEAKPAAAPAETERKPEFAPSPPATAPAPIAPPPRATSAPAPAPVSAAPAQPLSPPKLERRVPNQSAADAGAAGNAAVPRAPTALKSGAAGRAAASTMDADDAESSDAIADRYDAIRQLLATGQRERALAELAQLRAEYPDLTLPKDLRDLVAR